MEKRSAIVQAVDDINHVDLGHIDGTEAKTARQIEVIDLVKNEAGVHLGPTLVNDQPVTDLQAYDAQSHFVAANKIVDFNGTVAGE